MAAATKLYEVRGNFPDTTVAFFALKGEAEKHRKENPEHRTLSEHQVFLNAKGISKILNLLFAWQDDGVANKVEAGDKTRTDALKAEVERLRALVMEVYDEGDLMSPEEVEGRLKQ